MCGYIKLHRQILQWGWYDDTNTFRIFMHLLLKASSTNRVYKNIRLKKGQLITSVKLLSTETGLSTQQVRTCLKRLTSTNEIQQTTNMQYTIVTVKKWADFQGSSTNNQQASNNQITSEQQTDNKGLTNEQQTDNKPITTVKEGENDIFENNNLTVIPKKSANNYSHKAKPSRKTGTRFIAQRDSQQKAIIPKEFLEFANIENLDQNHAVREFQNFADYWEAKAGSQAVKLDWLATWRSWVRRSNNTPANTPKQGTLEAMKEVDCMIEQHGDIRPQSKYL